jgi:hypothetical protein
MDKTDDHPTTVDGYLAHFTEEVKLVGVKITEEYL